MDDLVGDEFVVVGCKCVEYDVDCEVDDDCVDCDFDCCGYGGGEVVGDWVFGY